jgi:hypothetical protein
VAVVLSFVLAWLTYTLIEKPFRFGSGRRSKPITLVLLMALIGTVGFCINITDGGSFRYPPQIRPLAAFQYDRQLSYYNRVYRSGACFLDADQPFGDIEPQCVDSPDGRPKLVVLWGDSHAASLYQGLKAQQAKLGGFRIAQFTHSACPPVVDTHGKLLSSCEAFNTAVFNRLKSLRPDVVVLEGNWTFDMESSRYNVDSDVIRNTIKELQAIGIRRVVVFGSLPTWKIPQPEVGVKIWLASHALAYRTKLYFDTTSATTDALVGKVAFETGVTFVSPIHLLCNEDGCLISTDHDAGMPVAWDREHLTQAGSNLLVGLAIREILGDAEGVRPPPSSPVAQARGS